LRVRTLGIAVGTLLALSGAAGATNYAGAAGTWTECALPARLAPDPAGRSFYVATWGTNPSSCPSSSGYTFRTIDGAARCAMGKDTIFVHSGTYGPVVITNNWPSARVLITNAPGENPVIEGWSSIGDWQPILGFWRVSNFAVQGLVIQNTGVPDAEHGGYGIKVSESSHIAIYFNTIKNTARHGIAVDGSQMDIVGNEISNAVMRNRWFQSNYWDAGFATDSRRSSWGLRFIANHVHDVYGECVDTLNVDGATVEGNRIYNCVSGNLYISNSRNVTVNRNWIYANTDAFNRPDYGYRAAGMLLANEGTSAGWSLSNVKVTNNIIEAVSQAIRYWRSRSGGTIHDTYGGLYIGFNDFNRTQFSPLRFDTPDGGWPTATSHFRQNIVINTSGWSWFSTNEMGAWDIGRNWNYGSGTQPNSPGVVYPGGTWPGAYDLRADAVVRASVAPWSEPGLPAQDYYCQARNPNNWNASGALQYTP